MKQGLHYLRTLLEQRILKYNTLILEQSILYSNLHTNKHVLLGMLINGWYNCINNFSTVYSCHNRNLYSRNTLTVLMLKPAYPIHSSFAWAERGRTWGGWSWVRSLTSSIHTVKDDTIQKYHNIIILQYYMYWYMYCVIWHTCGFLVDNYYIISFSS